jgi:hypothetical protein
VFAPVSVSVPVPLFVIELEPLITPAIETPLPFVSIVPGDVSVTARVDGDVIAPLACSVPPKLAKISVFVALPSPSAALAFAFNVPRRILVFPLYVFEPVNVSVPVPCLIRLFDPLITPAIETSPPLVKITPVAESETGRVDGDVIVPIAFSCGFAPEKTSVLVALPSPSAALEFASKIPAAIVVLPLYVFVPVNVRSKEPVFVSPPEPLITPAIEASD